MENLPEKKEEDTSLLTVARALFKSGIFPNVKNEFGAFAIVQYGHEMGIGPMTSLQSMAIVQGKICMSAQMMLSIALRNGVTYKIQKDTDEFCEILFKKNNIEYLSSFSIEEAKKAGIYKAQGGWEKYPRDMLFHRTVTRGLRRVCPDAILGLYAKEEIEDVAPITEPINITSQEQESKSTQIESPKPKQDFKFLKSMEAAKKELGKDKYYEILYLHELGHANEVEDPKIREEILKEMREEFKKKVTEKKDENTQGN